MQRFGQPKVASNWIMSELLRELKKDDEDIEGCKVRPEQLGELLELIDTDIISGKIAKSVFQEMYTTGKNAAALFYII